MLKSIADLLGLISLVALSIPAWYANRYGHLVGKMDLRALRLGEPEFRAQYDELMKGLRESRDGWRPWKGWCFYLGTAAGVVAAALVIWSGLNEHAPPGVH